ncbi:H-NS histone family protein [Leeia oryzae]|uniref:H-NS histone family protein n=1 Tax=Leeia oryzae TaxID=356662 RepID=UPI000475412A|nr:H-NS histone family protein [Leeia oryzae]
MSMNLSSLSIDELHALVNAIDHEIKSRKQSEINSLLKTVKDKAQALGMGVDELVALLAGKGSKGSKTPSIAKYANPANPNQTWTGRGRLPEWYKAALASGKTESDLAI